MAKSEQINVYMPSALRERIKAESAKRRIRSESMMVSILAEEALDAQSPKQKASSK